MNTDMAVLIWSLGFKLSTAILAYALITVLDWWWAKRSGVFKTHLSGADPQSCAIYLGLRRVASAVLIGLVIG